MKGFGKKYYEQNEEYNGNGLLRGVDYERISAKKGCVG